MVHVAAFARARANASLSDGKPLRPRKLEALAKAKKRADKTHMKTLEAVRRSSCFFRRTSCRPLPPQTGNAATQRHLLLF